MKTPNRGRRSVIAKIVIIPAAVLVFLASAPATERNSSITDLTPAEFAVERLEESGVSPQFINLILKQHDESVRDRIIETNVAGFMLKADYSGHYSTRAVQQCRQFMRTHRRALKAAEKRYGVAAEVIASLLWVETKHGRTLGTHSVLNVYFSLLQSDHPEIINSTLDSMKQRFDALDAETAQKVVSRSKAKASWAMAELKALEEIYQTKAKDLNALRGSYAGAFGIPQFIPTSYVQWAKSTKSDAHPNLYNSDDAILSVAHYLTTNGWKKNDREAQYQALYHYNRAQGYVEVILRLAKATRGKR